MNLKLWKKDTDDVDQKENEEDKKIKTFDDFLTHKVGVGLYQIVHLGTFYLLMTFGGYQTTFSNFTAAKMDHWCNIPELNNKLNQSMIRRVAIPTQNINSTKYDQCRMYSANYSRFSVDDLLNLRHLEGNVSTVRCRAGWKYDQSQYVSTLMSQYDLVCGQEYLATFAASAVMLGFFFGAIVSGQVSDRIGRVRTAIMFHLLAIGTAWGSIWAPVYPLYLVLRAVCGMAYLAAYTAYFTSCLECLSPTTRNLLPLTSNLVQVFSSWILPLTAYFVRNHIHLQIICACLMTPGFILNLLIPESARWHLAVGNVKEAMRAVKVMAWVNRRKLDDDCEQLLETISKEEQEAKKRMNESQKATVIDLFKTPRMRRNTFIVFGVWFAAVFGNYVIRLNIGTLIPGSIYLNFYVVFQIAAVVGVPFRYISFYKVGRRIAFMVLLITASFFAFANIGLLPTKINWLVSGASIVGYCFAATVFGVVYQYSAEIFPTVARGAGVGGGSSFGRIGGLIAPQIPLLRQYWYGLPYLIMGMIPLLSGISTFFLPETKDKKLPETLEEGELFGTRQYDERFGSENEKEDKEKKSDVEATNGQVQSNGKVKSEKMEMSDLPDYSKVTLDSSHNYTQRDPYYTDSRRY